MARKSVLELYRKAGLKPPKGRGIHTLKFHKCVISVKKKGKVRSPYAVCMASIGKKGAVRKGHRQKKNA